LNKDFTSLKKNILLKINLLIEVLQKQSKIFEKFYLINKNF